MKSATEASERTEVAARADYKEIGLRTLGAIAQLLDDHAQGKAVIVQRNSLSFNILVRQEHVDVVRSEIAFHRMIGCEFVVNALLPSDESGVTGVMFEHRPDLQRQRCIRSFLSRLRRLTQWMRGDTFAG